ncbi:MAG: PIG-L family deacetylase [Acidobacteriota bacterium]
MEGDCARQRRASWGSGPRGLRKAELRDAASVLGVCGVEVLDYPDGRLDQVDPQRIVSELAGYVRRIRPSVVLTFGPDGAYGHPDHIAVSQFAMAAVLAAADYGKTGVKPGRNPLAVDRPSKRFRHLGSCSSVHISTTSTGISD